MTLTALLPTLRRSIPDPLEPRHWPEHTVPTVTDVIVAGVALSRLAEVCGTPALLTGDLPHPKAATARLQAVGNDVTVLVFRVTMRVDTAAGKHVALTDCGFDRVAARWEDCRLIGRTSTAAQTSVELIPGESGAAPWPYPTVSLPADLHQGDLVAVPCIGAVSLRDVRPCTAPPTASATRTAELAATR